MAKPKSDANGQSQMTTCRLYELIASVQCQERMFIYSQKLDMQGPGDRGDAMSHRKLLVLAFARTFWGNGM